MNEPFDKTPVLIFSTIFDSFSVFMYTVSDVFQHFSSQIPLFALRFERNMSLALTEANFQHQRLRDAILERIQKNPDIYLDIGETFQSDPKICIATLMSYSDYMNGYLRIFDLILHHIPSFDDHKEAFFRFLQGGNRMFVEMYLRHFQAAIVGDREILTEAIRRDCYAVFFCQLSLPLCMDVELLRLAVENISENHLHLLVKHVPPSFLVEHEFILFRVLDRGATNLSPGVVPSSFWKSRDFIIRWTLMKGRKVPIAAIPATFRDDREICLALLRSQSESQKAIVNWIPISFLSDKRSLC
jgi:hypothetical protein